MTTHHVNPPAPDISQRPVMPSRRRKVTGEKIVQHLMSDGRAQELLYRSRALLERSRQALLVGNLLCSDLTGRRGRYQQLYIDICEELGVTDRYCDEFKKLRQP